MTWLARFQDSLTILKKFLLSFSLWKRLSCPSNPCKSFFFPTLEVKFLEHTWKSRSGETRKTWTNLQKGGWRNTQDTFAWRLEAGHVAARPVRGSFLRCRTCKWGAQGEFACFFICSRRVSADRGAVRRFGTQKDFLFDWFFYSPPLSWTRYCISDDKSEDGNV